MASTSVEYRENGQYQVLVTPGSTTGRALLEAMLERAANGQQVRLTATDEGAYSFAVGAE